MPSINASNQNRSFSQDRLPQASLGLPPRPIPLSVRSRVLFGGMLNQFSWLWLAFSMFFVMLFIDSTTIKGLLFSFATLETAPGTVLSVEETNFSENERSVYAIHYTFRIEQLEAEYAGVSYTTGYSSFGAGQMVAVEYQTNQPANSRIRGTRVSAFGPLVLFVLIFPLIGVLLLVGGVRLGIRGLRLLQIGSEAQGTLIDKQPTSTRINEQMVYKLTFNFADASGMRYQTSAKTHLPYTLEDEATERVLYDPRNPHYAVLLDNLPGRPEVDMFGRILPSSLLAAGLVLVAPALALLMLGLMVL